MTVALRLAGHLNDPQRVIELLKAIPGPLKVSEHGPGLGRLNCPVHDGHIRQLVDAKREDIANLLLSRISDPDVLDRVARSQCSAKMARVIVGNRATRTGTIAHLAHDPRAGVARTAYTALARSSGTWKGHEQEAIRSLHEMLAQPASNLTTHLEATLAEGDYSEGTLDWLLAAAAERSDTQAETLTWLSAIVGDSYIRAYQRTETALAENPATPTAALLALYNARSRNKTGASGELTRKLRDRSDLDPTERSRILAEYLLNSPWGAERYSDGLTADDAVRLLDSPGQGAQTAARACPHLPASAVTERVEDVLTRAIRSTRHWALLDHGAVQGKQLERAVAAAKRNPDMVAHLAGNPNLTEEQQKQLLLLPGGSSARHRLAANPAVSSESVQTILSEMDPVTNTSIWAQSTTCAALLANTGLSPEIKGQVPLQLVTRGVGNHDALGEFARMCEEALGDHGWDTLLALVDDWDDTIGSLLAAARTL